MKRVLAIILAGGILTFAVQSKSSLAAVAVEVAAEAEVEADVAVVAVAVPRVPVEGFLPRQERRVQPAPSASARPSFGECVSSALLAAASSSAEPGGGQTAAARPAGGRLPVQKLQPDLVAHAGSRCRGWTAPGDRRRSGERAAGNRPTLVSSIISSMFLVPQPAQSGQRVRQRARAVQRPISCKAAGHKSQRELSAVPPWRCRRWPRAGRRWSARNCRAESVPEPPRAN